MSTRSIRQGPAHRSPVRKSLLGRGLAGVRASAFALALGGMVLPLSGLAASDDGGPAQGATASASSPRYLGGLWDVERFFAFIDNAPLLPETKTLMDKFQAAHNAGQIIYTAWTSCRPGLPSAIVMPMNSVVILQGDVDITLSYEEPRLTQRVRMNAQHPANLQPSYMGDSVGHWEGNTLVIDTIGYNGEFQLDSQGLVTSPKLRTVERWTKSADGTRIDVETTIEDPVYYSEPFTIKRGYLAPKTNAARQQNEYDCTENPREEEFLHTYFIKDSYRPTCVRYEGKGADPSRILCRLREKGEGRPN